MDVPIPQVGGLPQIPSLACHARLNPITSSSVSHPSSVASATVPPPPPQVVLPLPSTPQSRPNIPLPTDCFLQEMCARVYHQNRQLASFQSPIDLSTGLGPYPHNPSCQTSTFDPTSLYLAAFAQLIVRQLVAQATTSPAPCNELPSLPNSPLAFLSDSNGELHSRIAALQHSVPWSVTPHSQNVSSQSPLDMTSVVTVATGTANSEPSPSACLPKSMANSCDVNGGHREKRYQCNYPGCSKAYYKRSHLNEHSHLHTGLKPHLCAQPGCGARFTRADQLSRHRRAHTGERNFYCSVCQKRFKRSDHLKVHVARNVCTKSTT